MSHRNFCFLLFLIKCFIRNWFGLGVNLIFIINAYIIFWANLMASVYAFIFCQSSCHHNMMMEWIGALKIWSRGVSLKWLSTNRSIGTPSEKLKPNQIRTKISHWKCNGWGARGLFLKGKRANCIFNNSFYGPNDKNQQIGISISKISFFVRQFYNHHIALFSLFLRDNKHQLQ